MSGIIIFGILGNLAFEMKVDPRQVLLSGEGTSLAFISYPDAISKFEAVPWVSLEIFLKNVIFSKKV